MIRLLASAAVLGGCLLTIGCDTSAGTGAVGPQFTVTGDKPMGSENVKPKSARIPPGGGGADQKKD